MTLAAVITHIISGTFAEGASRALVLAVGLAIVALRLFVAPL